MDPAPQNGEHMKLRDYKALLITDQRTAMLFDLTERHPRGPTSKLRAPDYEKHERSYDNVGAVLTLLKGADSAEGSTETGGWNPYEIYELPDDEWSAQRLLWDLEVAKEMAMGASYNSEEGKARLFKQGSQLTRRSRRFAYRIRKAKRWVEENIGTAVYEISLGGYGIKPVFVHADSEDGAKKQFELFMGGAFNKDVPNYSEDRVHVTYKRPAKTPLELMILNEEFQAEQRERISESKARVETLLKQIEAMDTAEQIVNCYAINMVATWGTGGEGDETGAE